MRPRVVALLVTLAGVACDGPAALAVTLRADWLAGQEVARVFTDVDGERVADVEVSFGDDLANGLRVAEVAGLAPGEHEVQITLASPEPGAFPAWRRVRAVVDQRGAGAVTVVITRDCATVHCLPSDARSECLGGRCVSPECTPERPEACPTPACLSDADCASASGCGRGVCAGGACLIAPDDAACGDGERCDPGYGCRAIDAVPLEARRPVLGRAHACASRDRIGIVYCWGSNLRGALGPHREARAHRAVEAFRADLFQVVAGQDFTCITEAGSSVICWGDPSSPGLGPDGIGGPHSVTGIFTATEPLWSGTSHACVSVYDGPICWGRNDFGQASPDDPADPAPPAARAGLGLHALGERHSCALDLAGRVHCWGANDAGQLGDGTEVDRRDPAPVAGLGAASGLAATSRLDGLARSTTCAIVGGGEVWCWGDGSLGQLGGAARPFSSTPVRVEELPAADEITAGAASFCARTDRGLWCWGRNADGELGLGAQTPFEATPVHAEALDRFQTVALGRGFGCGSEGDHVWCWGANDLGQVTGREDAPAVVLEPTQVLME